MQQIAEFKAIIAFIVELEKLKNVERRIKPAGLSRFENSAEHSWQIALLALTLSRYASQSVNELKVVTMLLLHDVVEIDTGDKFAYDANHDDYANEHAAAVRLFALLPAPLGDEFLALWEEFEEAKSPEAQFAKAIDRLMPILQNLQNGCQSWLSHNVSVKQILSKNAAIEKANPALWAWVKEQVMEKALAVGLDIE
ncbi:MAG: HD domain-containing protein [Paraglaciecola sp.]|uniref:HD domain-containing protein n=1 Tax=Pseudomonadati TaxID=3379134 RepID=UPI00273D13C3|nr:HD domain-containing protein [Paraglaciecola sp.]MDP5033140.1 HD domain-containing protein [Paraglaciecola sp.]MDP5039757.1 HD domain-containing protein [Paraglaciecola sp.]MDP5130214.1 HD domain-containing protein [Paraglaciecola sp.]